MKKIKTIIRKWINKFTTLLIIVSTLPVIGQVNDHGKKNQKSPSIVFREKSGRLDSSFKNPKPDAINSSENCVRYQRNAEVKYDYLKLTLNNELKNSIISHMEKAGKEPIKFRMKCYSSAPAGTKIEMLVGKNIGEKDYPDGTLGQFKTKTTSSGKWEELEFEFIQTPNGSTVSANQINQITLLFNPESSSSDYFYFDINITPVTKNNSSNKIIKD
jgi:hypothetical protein